MDHWYTEDWGFEGTPPKTIEQCPEPPDSYWFDILGKKWATNGVIAISESCPIRPELTRAWLEPSDSLAAKFTEAVARDWKNMPPHCGIFSHEVAGQFATLPGINAVGKSSDSIAHLIYKGELIAIVMPEHERSKESDFYFTYHFNYGV